VFPLTVNSWPVLLTAESLAFPYSDLFWGSGSLTQSNIMT